MICAYPLLSANFTYTTVKRAESLDDMGTIMSQKTFSINIWRGEDGYLIGQCVELPAAITQGKTNEEVAENMKEAIELVLQDMGREFQERIKKTHVKVEETRLITVEA
jgi:predicted RNase H-like HicB family nuclease